MVIMTWEVEDLVTFDQWSATWTPLICYIAPSSALSRLGAGSRRPSLVRCPRF